MALGERIPGDFVPNELSPRAADGIRDEAARHAGAQFERRHPRPELTSGFYERACAVLDQIAREYC